MWEKLSKFQIQTLIFVIQILCLKKFKFDFLSEIWQVFLKVT